MGNTKDSKSEPPPQPNNASTDWRDVEYRECSEDWRHRDRLIWATLPVAVTVVAVTVGIAYGQSLDGKLGLWVRLGLLLIGLALTVVMLISLGKHRFYQHGSEQQIWSLQIRLHIKEWDRSPRIHRPRHLRLWPKTRIEKINVKLQNWVCRRSGFNWMLGGILVLMAILVGLAIHTVVQLISSYI